MLDDAESCLIVAVRNAGIADPRAGALPLRLDTRPIFAAGQAPCQAIDEAVARLAPGQVLELIVPFEPFPLYAKLGGRGFTHCAEALPDGSWRIEFRPSA
jgi:hypothetical protein